MTITRTIDSDAVGHGTINTTTLPRNEKSDKEIGRTQDIVEEAGSVLTSWNTTKTVVFNELTEFERTTVVADVYGTHSQRRSNKDLSPAELSAKKLLKKHLRQRTRLRKYELRIQQAKIRDDQVAVSSARQEWREYMNKLEEDPDSLLFHCNDLGEIGSSTGGTTSDEHTTDLQPIEDRETRRVKAGREWIIQIYKTLVTRIMPCGQGRGKKQDIALRNERNAAAAAFRQQSTLEARELLANMQKGTQTEGMFNNDLALLGYTRQKFIERAVLAFTLLDRLDPANAAEGSKPCMTDDNMSSTIMWEKLMLTNQIMSIGCGPGCDLVGVLGFFESHGRSLSKTKMEKNGESTTMTASTPAILLLDYVMPQWKRLVLDQLKNLMISHYNTEEINMEQCDVRYPLCPKQQTPDNSINDDDEKSKDINEAASKSINDFVQWNVDDDGSGSCSGGNRMIVVSYLLTETRHQWKSFFHDLLSLLVSDQRRCNNQTRIKGGKAPTSTTLLLLTEPTAWQLHDFLNHFKDEFIQSHTWLDSSRYFPHLQNLEARMGPAAVMIALK